MYGILLHVYHIDIILSNKNKAIFTFVHCDLDLWPLTSKIYNMFFQVRIQIMLLLLASSMSVDTKCDRKIGIGIRNFLMCPLPDIVFRNEKKFKINCF